MAPKVKSAAVKLRNLTPAGGYNVPFSKSVNAGPAVREHRTTFRTHPAATLFPLLAGQNFDDLVNDIRANGLLEAIWLDTDGRILDGRNRGRACEAAGVEPRFQTYDGDDPVGHVVSLNLHRRHLTESQRAMAAARITDMPQGARTDLASADAMSQPDAAKVFNVSRSSVQRAARVLSGGSPELVGLLIRAPPRFRTPLP